MKAASGTAGADLKQRLERLHEIPTLPHIVTKVVSISNRSDTSAADLGRIIEKDQTLAAKVLRLANSPFYGFPKRIYSVSHAVVVLGLNAVKGLTLGATAFDMMKASGMEHLWRHSLGVAMMTTVLAPRAGLRNPEEVFVAGLLHDLGQVIISEKLSDQAAQIEQDFREHDCFRSEVEQEALGLTHADVAGWVADMWNLPTLLKDPMMFHHRPTLALAAPLHAAIVHVADILVKAMGCGVTGNNLVPAPSPEAWKLVRLDEKGLAACIDKATQEFETIDQYLA